MADHQPFLSQILCHPDDDGPRLVYADFLEEHGQRERAEFIRVQCELARLEAKYGKEEVQPYHSLRRRERELWLKYGDAWSEGLPGYPLVFTWYRGFPSLVEGPAANWLQHGRAIVRSQPIREVRLTGNSTVLPSAAVAAWKPFLRGSGYANYDWEQAALLWARQEPCSECSRKSVQKLIAIVAPHGICPKCLQCSGKGSVDFRTLLVKGAIT